MNIRRAVHAFFLSIIAFKKYHQLSAIKNNPFHSPNASSSKQRSLVGHNYIISGKANKNG